MPTRLKEPPDFSLVLGGPLYQMFRRSYLTGTGLQLLRRELLVLPLVAWLPLAVMSTFEGHVFGNQNLAFLHDIESHVRFLVALPVLILADLVVHERTREVVALFLERHIVTSEDTPRFYAAIESAMRMRNSVALEVALLVFVYTVGHLIWRHEIALGAATWYAVPEGKSLRLTLAGYWFSWVSVPLFQFILLRWYMRLAVWYRMLWRVSRLSLCLLPAHPDHAGGIGFLGDSSYAFAPVLFAQGAVLAGLVSSHILYQRQSLTSFEVSIVALVGFFVLVILGPLTMFTPLLSRTKRSGLRQYGALATDYVIDFDEKWVRGGAKGEVILGSGDIQSLADLATSFAIVEEMNLVPFLFADIIRLIVITALPLLPLLLTMMPLQELMTRALNIVF
jgi:hypothetical protein